jgi:hypothetical protein
MAPGVLVEPCKCYILSAPAGTPTWAMWTGEIYRHNLVLDVSLQMAAMVGCTQSNARSRKDQALSCVG